MYYINLIPEFDFFETPKALYEVCRIMCKIIVSRCYYPMRVSMPGEQYLVIESAIESKFLYSRKMSDFVG